MAIPRGDEMPARPPVSPGEILIEEFLRPMRLTQTDAAARMDMPFSRLNAIVRGRRGINAQTAVRLSGLLGTTPQFWLNLQMAVDLYKAKQDLEGAESHTAAGSPPRRLPSKRPYAKART